MMKIALTLALSTALLVFPAAAEAEKVPANGKVKIFILAGQSNMVGFGQVKGSPGTMETYVRDNPEAYGHLVDEQGEPVVRDDVWVVDLSGDKRTGWLTTGFGAGSGGHIGPEYGFGFAVGDHFEDPVVLIKSAWGGKSLINDFLPPSAGDHPEPEASGDAGFYYAEVLRHVKEVTGDLKKYFPDDAGNGYQIVGIGWHQGWNDRINAQAVEAYEENLVHFINDIRADISGMVGEENLAFEKIPFVIANSGFGGWDIKGGYKERVEKLMDDQLAVADAEKYPDFKGNVAAVETRDFQRSEEESPSGQGFHWLRNWETFYLIGKHMGDEMIELISE